MASIDCLVKYSRHVCRGGIRSRSSLLLEWRLFLFLLVSTLGVFPLFQLFLTTLPFLHGVIALDLFHSRLIFKQGPFARRKIPPSCGNEVGECLKANKSFGFAMLPAFLELILISHALDIGQCGRRSSGEIALGQNALAFVGTGNGFKQRRAFQEVRRTILLYVRYAPNQHWSCCFLRENIVGRQGAFWLGVHLLWGRRRCFQHFVTERLHNVDCLMYNVTAAATAAVAPVGFSLASL